MTYTPTEAGISEGNYTEWAWKWTNDIPDNVSGVNDIAFFIDEKNSVIVLTWRDGSNDDRFGIYNLSDFSTVFESTTGVDYKSSKPSTAGRLAIDLDFSLVFGGGSSRAIESYVLISRKGDTTIEVWRGGASLLWSHNITTEVAGDMVYSAAISLTGKHILVFTFTNKKLILYEGS